MVTSKDNNLALEILNNKLLEIKNDRSIKASCLLALLSKIANLGNSTHFN